jgi:hypothetical protein
MMRPIPFLLLGAAALAAQTVEVYSEFQRPDPFGGIVEPDRGWKPREILSPGVARNGFATFHVAVTVPAKESYFLYVIPNPVSACRVAVYKEHFVKTAAGWIPDRLTELQRLPDFGVMPDPDDAVEGQTTRVYLVDLWIPPDADVARFRLEVQLKVADWTVRPMEVRVLETRYANVPAGPDRGLPPVEWGAEAPGVGVLGEYLATGKLTMPPAGLTVRGILRRNAAQDVGLGGRSLMQRALELFQANATFWPRPMGSEWWLRMRDRLLTGR